MKVSFDFCCYFQGDVVNVVSRESELCLAASTGKVWLERCDPKSLRQKWKWL